VLHLYPNNTEEKLEFDKIKKILIDKCQMAETQKRFQNIRFHTKIEFLKKALSQTSEFKSTLQSPDPFPNNFSIDIRKALNLLKIKNATLSLQDLDHIRAMTVNIHGMLIWSKKNQEFYPYLVEVLKEVLYEKEINRIINSVIDDQALMKDTASKELYDIREELQSMRIVQRKTFEKVLKKLNKNGMLADTGESFVNGRRTVAVLAEYKRQVNGILHGESESRKTVFIEPEETIYINNQVGELERAEQREVLRVLKETTQLLSQYQPILEQYFETCIEYDFIAAKAKLAIDLKANMPQITAHPELNIINGIHPILFLHNQKVGKETVPLSVQLNRKNRILIISGPNAGGKTISMKTVGLLQLMLQAGLLLPVHPDSTLGIFKEIFIHIGDTQSIENELSTYSAHLKDMKYFVEMSSGKTLFCIDELGGGSDPHLGGAFAEAIVEALVNRNALGVITTHYLNLKVMAGRVKGIINGAMAFDESKLLPMYQLQIGKPGSSYTFAIAKRSKMPQPVIDRAQALIDKNHISLDNILQRTQAQSQELNKKLKKLDESIAEFEKKKNEYEKLIDKEEKNQRVQTIKLQNKIKQEELEYLKNTERKLKQIIQDWKKTDNKEEVMAQAEKVLFNKKIIQANQKAAKKADKSYQVIGKVAEVGDLVRHTSNHQVGTIVDIEGKKCKVKIGKLVFQTELNDWVTVRKKTTPGKKQSEIEKG